MTYFAIRSMAEYRISDLQGSVKLETVDITHPGRMGQAPGRVWCDYESLKVFGERMWKCFVIFGLTIALVSQTSILWTWKPITTCPWQFNPQFYCSQQQLSHTAAFIFLLSLNVPRDIPCSSVQWCAFTCFHSLQQLMQYSHFSPFKWHADIPRDIWGQLAALDICFEIFGPDAWLLRLFCNHTYNSKQLDS